MLDLDAISVHAGRPAADLTRRDVARALLSVPADEALDALPALRRELAESGAPVSEPFWTGAEDVLTRLRDGAADLGEVDRFLEATGTQPARTVGITVWEDEGDRSEVEEEMHRLLVAHLEERLTAGEIDPDRLASGDENHRAEWLALQQQWLQTPLPDGRTPAWTVEEDKTAAMFAAVDKVEAAARKDLSEALGRIGERPCPVEALHRECNRLRPAVRHPTGHYAALAAAAGLRRSQDGTGTPAVLPDDDQDLWLQLAAGTVYPRDDPPDIGPAELAAWYSISQRDWYRAVVVLAHAGPGAPVSPDSLGEAIAGEAEDKDPDVLAGGFSTVVDLWQAIGAVDADDQLTPLGWWGLPEAILRAWSADH